VSIANKAKDRAKRNPTWLLGILLGTNLILVSLNRAPSAPDVRVFQAALLAITSPVQSALAHSGSWIKDRVTNYFSMRDARGQNAELLNERAQLQTQIIDLNEKIRSLSQVKALADWQSAHSYPATPARVVGRDANEFFNTVVIDKGSASDVAKDQPVVTPEGLVGRVISVSLISARVLLITDERHAAGAIIGQTAENRLLGIIKGKSKDLCEMKFMAAPDKIEDGEQVITSGQDGIYPKGLLIGLIKKTGDGSGAAPLLIEVQPAAPLAKLETVAVLLSPPEQIRREIDATTKEEKKQDKNSPDRKKR
jgi:rod shape-determining protein MreC